VNESSEKWEALVAMGAILRLRLNLGGKSPRGARPEGRRCDKRPSELFFESHSKEVSP